MESDDNGRIYTERVIITTKSRALNLVNILHIPMGGISESHRGTFPPYSILSQFTLCHPVKHRLNPLYADRLEHGCTARTIITKKGSRNFMENLFRHQFRRDENHGTAQADIADYRHLMD